MDKLFDKTKDFRERATKKDCQELLEYFKNTPSKEWEEESCPYGFSRSSAINLLREKGFLEEREVEVPKLDICFGKLQVKQHTIYVTDEVWERMQHIYKDYECVDKKNVLDAFLRKALDDMGC